jgi:lipoprotein-anchoring transpeptidase ErfK/SrfK
MLKILVSLPVDRTQLGTLTVVDDQGEVLVGPFPCDGKSDNEAAIEAGNPTRNPELPFGDTPLGEYTGALRREADSPAAERSFGPPDESGAIPIVALSAQQGPTQAWRAFLNHRTGLAIHCGDPNGQGGLRPTHGCIRLSNVDDHAMMLATLGDGHVWQVSVTGPADQIN